MSLTLTSFQPLNYNVTLKMDYVTGHKTQKMTLTGQDTKARLRL